MSLTALNKQYSRSVLERKRCKLKRIYAPESDRNAVNSILRRYWIWPYQVDIDLCVVGMAVVTLLAYEFLRFC